MDGERQTQKGGLYGGKLLLFEGTCCMQWWTCAGLQHEESPKVSEGDRYTTDNREKGSEKAVVLLS